MKCGLHISGFPCATHTRLKAYKLCFSNHTQHTHRNSSSGFAVLVTPTLLHCSSYQFSRRPSFQTVPNFNHCLDQLGGLGPQAAQHPGLEPQRSGATTHMQFTLNMNDYSNVPPGTYFPFLTSGFNDFSRVVY